MVKIAKTLIFLAAIIFVGYYLSNNTRDYNEISLTKDKQDPITLIMALKYLINRKYYAYAWFQISNPSSIYLYPNFDEKYSLDEGINKYDCKNLMSGGFYTETHSPIGLFITEAEILGNPASSSLFNGYFTLTKSGKANISKNYTGELVRIGLQSGPVLIQNNMIQQLSLANDKTARRNIVALTKEGEILFITLYDKESVFIGPLLADLPDLLSEIQNEIGIEFTSALNLDGGSASAFYTQSLQLSELTPIGSFFCEK